jgi:fatty-acyl-CoA synthase
MATTNVQDGPARSSASKAWLRALAETRVLTDRPGTTLASLLDGLADAHGDRTALLDHRQQLSYRALAARANQYARWAMHQHLAAGDVVCLLMPNCPEYVALWLGVTRAGCAVALINTNLVAEALVHSIAAAEASHLIVDGSLLSEVPGDRWPGIETAVAGHGSEAIDTIERALPSPRDRALLIYTSGTTGLPKAANVTHARVAEWSLWFAGLMDAQPTDRLYNCLPMYHSVGGIVAIGAMLVRGGSVLIRDRFSASRFWDDVCDGNCTIFQYIGELCRYLVRSPQHPRERQHRLRLACGNGLQGDVWKDFQQRFDVPRILEFYAATEGILSLYNCEGKVGSIGRIPPFLAHRFRVALIRCDAETGAPQRDANGLCIARDTDQAGEAIADVRGGQAFAGYTDRSASARKLLHDVFVKGDCWFRTGDLMRRDAAGYFYFMDRLGDTFRWRGENVSTTQVAAVLRAYRGVADAVVFGVSVPGNEGRAGMAVIAADDHFSIDGLAAHLSAHLPSYARPLFLRCRATLEVTGTFKLTKGKLAAESYLNSTDPVWFYDRNTGNFIACDQDVLRSINHGVRRL